MSLPAMPPRHKSEREKDEGIYNTVGVQAQTKKKGPCDRMNRPPGTNRTRTTYKTNNWQSRNHTYKRMRTRTNAQMNASLTQIRTCRNSCTHTQTRTQTHARTHYKKKRSDEPTAKHEHTRTLHTKMTPQTHTDTHEPTKRKRAKKKPAAKQNILTYKRTEKKGVFRWT